MEKTLSTQEVMSRLRAAMYKGLKERASPGDYNPIYADYMFASVSMHLNALASLATMCDSSIESGDLSPELEEVMGRFSGALHVIVDGLDESISQIAEICDYEDWRPVRQFEEELKQYINR